MLVCALRVVMNEERTYRDLLKKQRNTSKGFFEQNEGDANDEDGSFVGGITDEAAHQS